MTDRSKKARKSEPKPQKLSPEAISGIRYKMLDDTWHARASAAQTEIFQLEALLECIDERIDGADDEHLPSLVQLSKMICTSLRLSLYGKDMSP